MNSVRNEERISDRNTGLFLKPLQDVNVTRGEKSASLLYEAFTIGLPRKPKERSGLKYHI